MVIDTRLDVVEGAWQVISHNICTCHDRVGFLKNQYVMVTSSVVSSYWYVNIIPQTFKKLISIV